MLKGTEYKGSMGRQVFFRSYQQLGRYLASSPSGPSQTSSGKYGEGRCNSAKERHSAGSLSTLRYRRRR